ncbi:MAG: choice-of-anchor tandem repeat GloVer-containing protein [Candidatus Korobacteraceae bacterium]|jgi:uncharacterized repeat protein (TIGR03803 family)
MTRSEHHRSSGFARLAGVALLPLLFVTAAAQAQTFTVLHTFTGGADGANPYAGLVLDGEGNLYGVTEYGGNGPCSTQYTQGCGTVFRMKHSGSGWYYEPLYSFMGMYNHDGAYPFFGGLTVGPDGSLYGTTTEGGEETQCDGNPGCGTVFNLKPPPTRPASVITPWVETVLYRFQQSPDGNLPEGQLAFDSAGNLYGTTVNGNDVYYYWGTAFELTPAAGTWSERIIYNFQGDPNDGAQPLGGLVMGPDGNLYGTTFAGGTDNAGTLFRLSPSGSGWTETVLYKFIANGTQPYSAPIFDSAGNLYGGTTAGEQTNTPVAYEMSPPYLGTSYSILYSWLRWYSSGPAAPLMMDSAGNLYGTTTGSDLYGTVFKLTPYNGYWIQTTLHDFTRGADGGTPYCNVVMDAQGNLYGTASRGGDNADCPGGCGVVWEITP